MASSVLALLSPSVAQCPAGAHRASAEAQGSDELFRLFGAAHSGSVSLQFGDVAALRFNGCGNSNRQFASFDDVFCIFTGSLHNLCQLRQTYGLVKSRCTEANLVIEVYKALRDRAPFPMSQALSDFRGSFSFVLFDQQNRTALVAVDADNRFPLFWGTCQDGSVALSDDVDLLRQGCSTSFAPFPAGCFFTSSSGLRSFEHPDMGLRAVPHVDQGRVCGSSFVVDPSCKMEGEQAPNVGSYHDLTALSM